MKFPKSLFTTIALAASLAAAPASAQDAEETDDMASYSATYQLSLNKLRLDGWAERAGGTMNVRFARDCFHWHQDRDMKFVIRFTDGRRTVMVVSEKYRETLNGGLFWYWSRTTLNGKTVQIITGAARPPSNDDVKAEKEAVQAAARAEAEAAAAAAAEEEGKGKPRTKPKKVAASAASAEAGATPPAEGEKKPEEEFKAPTGLVAVYDWPKNKRVWMPEHVSFPFTALRDQLKSLQTGSLIAEQSVFDGSFKDGPLRVRYNPAGTASAGENPLPEGETELLDTKTWRFNIDYFPLEGVQKEPLRSSTIKLHANGVVSEMVIELAPFSINAIITSIKSEKNTKACG